MIRLRRLTTILILLLLGCMFSKALAADYHYYVINLSGEIATQARASQAEGSAPTIPDVIKSYLIDDNAGSYSYYTVDQFNVDEANNIYTLKASPTVLSVLPSENTSIYVKYTYDNSKSAIDLSGETIYYVKDQDKYDPTKVHYMTFNKKWTSADWRTDGSTNADDNFGDNDKERQWVYEGNDPYKIYIRNVYRRDAGADSYVRSDLAKGKFEDNNNVRYGGLNTDKLFNTFFFDKDNHIVAANNVYNWNGTTNRYIYYAKEDKTSYGDIGGRFLTTGTARLNLTTLNIVKSSVTDATIHLVNQTAEPHKETFSFNTPIDTDNPKPSATVLARLTRLGATLGTTYYKEAELTNAITTPLNVTDIYIPYTVDATTLSNTYHITFSTEANPEWFSMVCTRNGGKQMEYNSSANEINSSQAGSTARAEAITGQYAFIGDPYSFRVITKSADGQYAYVDTKNNNKVRFSDTPDNWALIPGTAGGTFQIFRRDDFLSTYRAFWDAYNGGSQIRMTAQSSGSDLHANRNIMATATPKYNYTYTIVDKSGRIAIKYTVSQYVSTRLDGDHGHEAIPEAIYSPYLKGETLTFYSTLSAEGSRENLSNPITVTPASHDIYVSYTTELLNTRSLPLDGKSYSVKVGGESGKYVKYDSGLSLSATLPNPRTDEANFSKHVWFTSNEDPYNVSIQNNTPFALLDNSTKNTKFILMKGSSNDESQVELLLASGQDIRSEGSKSLALNAEGDAIELATTLRGTTGQQVIFTDATVSVYYRIIDKQKKIVIQVEDKTAQSLNVPAAWRSPLCTYHYWKRSDFIESGGIYTLKDGVSEITDLSKATDGYIYVTYDVADNNIITQVDPTARVHQNGSATGAWVRDYENSWGQMFMIKFANGEEFYQEIGDSLQATKKQAVYPYSNGDSGFNIYDETKWEGDKVSASTTRTRWSWYVLSENNDPYHVKITSWQGSHSRKLSGDDVNTSFYNYWRTYYNSAVGTGGSIVTATISDDPQVLDDSKTGGSANNVPTEYMLLGTTGGTTGNYKLVTTNEITGVDDHATYGKHRPVNSFLQYWKTYETISRKGVKPKNGEALPYDKFKDQSQNPYSFFSVENVTAHPVYKFDAWQNARPIYTAKPDSSLSKKYEYAYHYYQKISLGETFDLVEHSIDGILVLLDNHGWEIMRKPMAKTGDATKASRDADIRKFDSPMVKTYHFWSTATKTTGYHKYTKWNTEKGTGTSLADYPEVLNSNGNVSDLFVTYEVKPEYAELYTVTKNGSTVTGAVADGKTFLIRQDSRLGWDNNGTLTANDDANNANIINKIDTGQSVDGLADTYYWYLAPNWDIDKEMGYKYATSATTANDSVDISETTNGLYNPRTETESRIAYFNTNRAGFDPYNIQIYNKSTNRYFTIHASNPRLDTYNAMAATFTDKNLTLESHHDVNTENNNGVGHDATNLHMTNQTFMAVQDANGNMRLIPRFDHYNAIENFTSLDSLAKPQPEDDKIHGQSTWLLRPPAHVYIVVDNDGYEALRYTALSGGAPVIPAKYRSPLAENFTFYKAATYNEETHKYTLDNSNLIIGSFTENSVADEAIIYVRYQYNPDADTDALLKGMWYNAKLNGSDVKVTEAGVKVKESDSDDLYWRFMKSAGSDSDPYAVTLWNGTLATESNDQRYILMKHSSGEGYALMKAANESTTDYLFLDGTSNPAFAAQSGYTTNGTIDATKKLTLTPVLATSSITYKIITHSGKVALTSDEVTDNITKDTNLADKLPSWMKSPLMEDDAYVFYSAATERLDGTYDIKGVPTTSPTTLDGNVVYVRYDYEKSKKVIEDFGILGTELPLNVAPLDLSGNVKYVLTVGGENDKNDNKKLYGKKLEVAYLNSTDYVNPTDINITDNKLTSESCVWTITGNDPYECTIHNGDKIIAGKWWGNDREAANATDYPLAKLCTAKVATDNGYYSTFMVLRHNEQESANPGKLKLYFTGHDNLWLAESNAVGKAQLNTTSSTGGLYVFKDSEPYKTRYNDATGEPIRKDSEYKVFSRFTYRPVMTYHIITNSKKEALEGYSLLSDATVEMPEVYQSPLLNSSDFIYITKATETDGIYTVSSVSSDTIKAPANTTIASMVKEKIGDIYVRYTYNSEKSPFKIATNINDAAEDGTRLSWIDEKGLDLSGKTWYTIANMQKGFGTAHGTILGTREANTTSFQKINVTALTNGRAPSQKEYLWKLEGNDPYAIKISNGYYGDDKYMSITTNSNRQEMSEANENYCQTFMLLSAHHTDNGHDRFDPDKDGETNYLLKRWTVLIGTGTNRFMRCTLNNIDNDYAEINSSDDWSFDQKSYSEYDIRMSGGEVVTRKIINMGGGSTMDYCVEFVKAPVSRKYHYHAYNQTTGKWTWDAVLEHDWLQEVVLEDVIARQYCNYETRSNTVDGDNVTPTNTFDTRWALKQKAQFYSDPGFTKRVKDTNSGKYDIYPEIELDDVYNIYFKYQVDGDATLKLAEGDKKLSDITSTPAQIAADAAHYNNLDYATEEEKKFKEADGRRFEPGYTQKAKWFFMVLDTDENISAKTGRQLFLRREDDGTVNWMNNNYSLHKEDADNYKGWSYNRVAEWYRKGDNDAFREGRWLWTFVGDDPYNMRIINFESAVGVKAESAGVYSLAAGDNCYTTISRGATSSGATTYPITIPTEEPTENQYWGLCVGVANSQENTFSLLSTAMTDTIDEKPVNMPLYWHMVSRTANKVTTESVEGMLDYVADRSYAIQLLPYVPIKYQDVKLVIRRDDDVTKYYAWKDGKNESQKADYANNNLTTGLSRLYFSASERKYVAGDVIDTSADDALPLQVRRAFCDYTMYSDIFETTDTKYTVKEGPYPNYNFPKTGQFDDDGRQIYAYYNVDSNGNFTDEVPSGAQAIYVKYVVTSDIFLMSAPTKTEVEEMANTNDHVYFMDFPDPSGKATYHHAYYDPMSTMREKTGDLKTQRDDNTGSARPEKRRYNSTSKQFEDDTQNWYNHYEYRTTHNRMESVPENLKWYFVGDPYKVQVFNTAGEWNTSKLKDEEGNDIDGTAAGTVAANLARFNPVESNFQFAIDCVHLRVKNPSIIDKRETLRPYKEDGSIDTEAEEYHNRHYNQPYFNDFYWECVPTTSEEKGTFALRFKDDNQLLGYRNVYYYLAHDGLSKVYQEKNYSINLSYSPDNAQHETGKYAGYHTANDVNTIIKLVQPVKVYVTAKRNADDRYSATPPDKAVVKDELSEYYGLGETITEVPRHLQRKFVQYDDLTDKDGSTMGEHELIPINASSYGTCGTDPYTGKHSETINDLMSVKVSKDLVDPVFKFSVWYSVSDLSKDPAGNDAHLFTPNTTGSLNWVDMAVMGNGNNWLFFDKTQSDKTQIDKTQVSNYRTAVGDNTADGWNDGLKGLHWALVGDPYDFTILNRRRYEDGKNAEPQWLTVTKLPANTLKDIHGKDSTVWTTAMVTEAEKATYNATTSTGIAAADNATHFSVQMWKLSPKNSNGTYQTGNDDAYYFLRTASIKESENDFNNGNTTNTCQTNNYWRMVAKAYPNASSPTSYFEMVPYSLSEKSTYTNTQYFSNYSKTMNGMGVTQQRLEIRTAVAEDEDDADNNCFDADVEIRTLNGVLKLKRNDMEIRYGNIEKALPATLRRYGCSYKCYLNYDPATNSGTEIINFGEKEGEEGYTELHAAMTTAETAHSTDTTKSPRPLLTYVYTVNDDLSPFFTSEQDARTEDYTWANSYFYWEQTYTGSSVEVQKTRLVFDHYVYNSDGKIIDEVWREEPYTEVVNNPTEPFPTKGYLNSHNGQTPVYADETVQKPDNRQKWSMTGDPYGFTMKNYAQYLDNTDAIVNMSGTDVITQNYGDGQMFAYVVDKKGTPYLAIINSDPNSDSYGNIQKLIDFEFSSTSNKTLESVGDGINSADATGNTLATKYVNSSGKTVSVKPFYLVNLMSYADLVQYHLVMAHQYSLNETTLDHLDDDTQKKNVNDRMLEFLKYWGIQEHNDKDYFLEDNPGGYKTTLEYDIKKLLKEKGTLRNFLSYPVVDQVVERVGVDNKPQVPWYMKRQFCTYHMYQRDLQRSVVDNEHPSFQQVNDEWTGKTCTIVLGHTYKDSGNKSYTANEAFVNYYAGQVFKSNDGTNPIPMTFEENGVTKQAFNVKWVSIFDESSWSEWTEVGGTEGTDYKIVDGVKRKIPSGYTQASGLQGVELDKIYECHQNRRVFIDVIYEVNPNRFRFAQEGRNTTAWYQMMTNNAADGLMNFTYKDGIGARMDRSEHYTNNYLWAPEGDPYGFVLRSRYATINGTGWDDVAVTTDGKLPKGEDTWGNPIYIDGNGTQSDYNEPSVAEAKASYTGRASAGTVPFDSKRIVHLRAGQGSALTDGATNAVYEMFVGGFDGSFLMHPTSAWMDNGDVDHESYYMVHNTADDGNGYSAHQAYLRKYKVDDLRYVADANWRLICTDEQLLPYFERSGYVGGLKPSVAQNFRNQEYYNQLRNGTELNFTDIMTLQKLVYSGKFKDNTGAEVPEGSDRPNESLLPMTFESDNLVNMKPGYYRIKAFSQKALDIDGNDMSQTGIKGITGPRYISGYRFESEKRDNEAYPNQGGRWLHFLETDKEHADIHTYADLKAKISAVNTAVEASGKSEELKDRDVFDHKAMAGNIEILPADFDPSSIFHFTEVADNESQHYTRYDIRTQGLQLRARAGGTQAVAGVIDNDCGHTELADATDALKTNYDYRFRLNDIGGAAVTLRTIKTLVGTNTWDDVVSDNLKTNYVCIDRHHRYRITCHKDNEMVEIGDHTDGFGTYGIQDTKWLLQPVGIHEEWPYNEMPLRVEVQQGGVKNQELTNLTNPTIDSEENKDKYYYGSLYVPFDTRLSNTTDAAFTLTNEAKANTTTVTMQSVSQLNGMGNPQYVPAGWPVVIRTSLANSTDFIDTYPDKHYVNMYLPYDTPQTGLDDEKATIVLRGEYLERTLDDTYMRTKEGNNEYTLTGKSIMVFGLPYVEHVLGTDANEAHHEYNSNKQVGWYTNDNWARENHPELKAHTDSYPSTASVATDAVTDGKSERDNKYVYHNKVYYPYDKITSTPARQHFIAIFDDEFDMEEEDKPIDESVGKKHTPWPCNVYDLQGRLIAEDETPETLRRNNPSLKPGVYIFGTVKVVVR